MLDMTSNTQTHELERIAQLPPPIDPAAAGGKGMVYPVKVRHILYKTYVCCQYRLPKLGNHISKPAVCVFQAVAKKVNRR